VGERLAVFFDIGDTLASPVLTGGQLSGLDVYPFVPEVLDGFGDPDVVLGLISNTPATETAQSMRAFLDDAGLLDRFQDELLLFSSVEGLDKSDPAFFDLARQRAGVAAGRCLFVGESEAERTVAEAAGFMVSPHPLHALHLVREEP
jgi:FMN phosphatase YigB (HAD superfamily)